MTPFTLSVISGFTILLPTGAGVLRFRRIGHKYLPLFILLAFGSLSELISYFLIKTCGTNMVNANIDILVDFLLTVWLFYKINSGFSKKFLIAVSIAGILLWATDNLIVHSLHSNNSVFRMAAAFLIVFLSMDKLNQVFFGGGLVENNRSDLVLSIGFLGYYTLKAYVEANHLFPFDKDRSFYIILWVILGITNMIVNLLFTVAILCISQKNRISIRS